MVCTKILPYAKPCQIRLSDPYSISSNKNEGGVNHSSPLLPQCRYDAVCFVLKMCTAKSMKTDLHLAKQVILLVTSVCFALFAALSVVRQGTYHREPGDILLDINISSTRDYVLVSP